MVLLSTTGRRFAGWLVPLMCLVGAVASVAGGLADRERSRLLVTEPVALQALEAGARPPRVHLEIGTHYALLGSVLPVERAGGDDANSASRFYTPLVSSPPATLRGGKETESSLDGAPKSGLRVFALTSERLGPGAEPRRFDAYTGYLARPSDWQDDLSELRARFPGVDWSNALFLRSRPAIAVSPWFFFTCVPLFAVLALVATYWQLIRHDGANDSPGKNT